MKMKKIILLLLLFVAGVNNSCGQIVMLERLRQQQIVTSSEYDAAAQLFITNTGISSPAQKTNINNLVLGLKTDGLWIKIIAFYPMIGGTASSHKYNLKDARDLDVAFRLNFYGGWLHSSAGVQGNGVNSYANTFIVPSNNMDINSFSLFFYNKSNTAEQTADIGANQASTSSLVALYAGGSTEQLRFFGAAFQGAYNTLPDTRGLVGFTKNSLLVEGFLNGNKINERANVISKSNDLSLYIGARNNDRVADYFSSRQGSCYVICSGLTATEITKLNQRIQNFETNR